MLTQLPYLTGDMELDDRHPSWQELAIFPEEMENNEFCRTANPEGFYYPCCNRQSRGDKVNNGCRIGRHQVADGKRTKFPGKPKMSFDEAEGGWYNTEEREARDQEAEGTGPR